MDQQELDDKETYFQIFWENHVEYQMQIMLQAALIYHYLNTYWGKPENFQYRRLDKLYIKWTYD